MRPHAAFTTTVTFAMLLVASPAAATETVATFSLDGLSFISFGDQQILLPETGSSIVFHFDEPNADGSVDFTIAPADVTIPPITLPGNGGTLEYAIASPTSGSLEPTPSGRKLTFTATVKATLTNTHGGGTYQYVIPFSTETASAANDSGTDAVSVQGMRIVDGAGYGQLVGATTNKSNAFPKPGTAVYTVLSGQFDQLP